jgi:hypothetical protein
MALKRELAKELNAVFQGDSNERVIFTEYKKGSNTFSVAPWRVRETPWRKAPSNKFHQK